MCFSECILGREFLIRVDVCISDYIKQTEKVLSMCYFI